MGMDVLTIHPDTRGAIRRLSEAIKADIVLLDKLAKDLPDHVADSQIWHSMPLNRNSYIAMLGATKPRVGSADSEKLSTTCSEP